MPRVLKSVLGAGFVALGVLLFGLASVSAGSSQENTTLTLTVGSSISMTGLAATYSATAPAGATTEIDTGPVTIATNNATGYNLALVAAAANFVGSNPAHTMPVGDDSISACSSTFTSCGTAVALSTGLNVIKTTAAATAGDVVGVKNMVAVPGAQIADTYTLGVSYIATTNP